MYISHAWFLCKQSVKDEKEARICEMEAKLSKLELEKVQLVSTCTKRLQALNDAKLEKDDLLQELQAGQRDLAGLAGREPQHSSHSC